MKKKLDLTQLHELRKQRRLNQHDFWSRFGVTQSGGSRYETGRPIPKPLALLLHLWHSGKITDEDLALAAKALGWPRRKATVGK
jgi:hypothetical protein